MVYLLDVSALIALGFINHEFHDRVANWAQPRRPAGAASLHFATCSITELGFVRVLSQAPAYGFTVAQARTLLLRLKRSRGSLFGFIPDAHDVSYLPGWARWPKQVTDAHLAKLANANGAVLATLDETIPGSFLIPRSHVGS